MPINKIVFGGTTLLDLSNTTFDSADDLLSGITGVDRSGTLREGTATAGSSVGVIYQDENGYVILDDGEPFTKSISITENGTYNVAGYGSAVVYVAGGGGGITPTGNINITQSGQTDVTNYATATVPLADCAASLSGRFSTENNQRIWTASAEVYAETAGWVNEGASSPNPYTYMAVPANTTITPSTSSQTIGGANYMMEGAVTVSAMPSMTLPSAPTSSSSGTQKAVITTSTSSRYLNIPTGYNSTAQYYNITPVEVVPLSVTSNGTYYASDPQYDVDGFSSVTVNVSGGGGGASLNIATASVTPSSASSSISFTSLSGEPTSFIVMAHADLATGASPYKVAAVVFDGTSLHGQTITNTSNAQVTYDGSSFSKSYSNGTLTITSTGAYFQNVQYGITYSYNGGTIDTKDVQVGSGATSITFTGLEEEPQYWSCIFKSNFSTSSGYQRVIATRDCDGVNGLEMDSGAHFSSAHWTSSYSNGSLTITSSGTNAGGYFHQPGYYQLTYAYDDGSGGGNYQTKSATYTPSTSQQTDSISADIGYDALKKVNVTVNAMPTMTLPTAASSTSSGTSKATITPTTSAQYLNIPTGYNDTAQYYTIAATSGGGTSSKNVQAYLGYASRTANSYGATNVTLTVAKTGTYKICWMAWRGSSSGTMGTNLHIGSTTGTNQQKWTGTYGQCITLNNQSLTANQVLTLYATSGSNSRTIYVGNLIIEEQ